MSKKVALGKGIASLIRETPNRILAQSLMENQTEPGTPASPVSLHGPAPAKKDDPFENAVPPMVPVASIKINPKQPRKIFREKELEELAESIKENGIVQPLIVAPLEGGKLELIAGERRLRAAQRIGLELVPVVLKKRATERDKMIMSIIENVQRDDLNCIEEALAYYRLMEEFKLTQQAVAAKVGKTRSGVANHLRILKLPRDVIDLIQKDLLSLGHAKVLAGLADREEAILLANRAAEGELSVRELEKIAGRGPAKPRPKPKPSDLNDRYDSVRQELEQNTGFHVAINAGKGEKGQVVIKFSDREEFNRIYDFLLRR